MRSHMSFSVAATMALLLMACSGGGNRVSSVATGTAAPAAVSLSGPITAFGSVVVNGVHYDIGTANIMVNGESATQSQLSVGQIARVHGSASAGSNTGQADRVEVDEVVIGPAAHVNATAGTLTVLGQSVMVDSNTSYGQSFMTGSLADAKDGDLLGVSGLVAADGHINATRIEREAAGHPLQIVGTVSGLDTNNHKFMINALNVNYSAATLSGFGAGAPANGDLVLVRGTTFDLTSSTLTAKQVAPGSDESNTAAAGDRVEREGLITAFRTVNDFDVAQKPVATTSSTTFVGGTVADLGLNVRVEVEGKLDSMGVLQADRVVIRKAGIVGLRGALSAVDSTKGTVTLLGVTVTVTADTRLEDDSSAHVAMFGLKDLAVGDTVLIRGYENPVGSGAVTATRLEREPPTATTALAGFYAATMAPQFKILGTLIDTTTAKFYVAGHSDGGGSGQDGASGSALTAAQFFAQAPGHVVAASGTLNGTTLQADRVLLVLGEDFDGAGVF